MACGGALLKRMLDRRKFLRRYAERVAKLVGNSDEIQAHFRENPKAGVVRERRLCGKAIAVELILIEGEHTISVAVSEPGSFYNNFFPVTVWAELRDGNLRKG